MAKGNNIVFKVAFLYFITPEKPSLITVFSIICFSLTSMKRITVLFTALLCFTSIFSQSDSLLLPYQKFPTLPPVKLLLKDSASFYSKADLPKKKLVMLMIFSPDCDHCKHETEELVKNIVKFKNVHIVMASFTSITEIKKFREKYNLSIYKNIVMAQDTHYFLLSFFSLHNMPFLAFYNRKKELISINHGPMAVEKMLEELKK